jgi:mono/diheme cytochrome c family protein
MRSTTRFLTAALALTTLGGCKPLDDTMVAIFGRSMRDSRSFDPYENPVSPPENAVSFASGNFPTAPGVVNVGQPEGVDVPPFTQMDMMPIGTGNEVVAGMVNPISMDDEEAMARGEEMYLRFCAVCHGPNGVGTSAYIALKHPTVGAYNLSGTVVQGYSDQYIYGMIRVGRGLMPAYGPRITHFDRWMIVNYVRLLQQDANAAAQPGEEG